ncbi:universal stress protein [Actinomycetospora endophytica]|uniref:Universal stress protein n=1 Tax=Actinomycetospora endophytica TaxID=2291215 RepID=A0ABS8PC61_9PSEU|nr:universal stress protein [Actinomycetospora endophytica]MCD2194574.1 universal stress protein [Actinomycetospora endophytica]
MSSYTRVAVGTDGSESAGRAVGRAARVAAASGATLLIVCAYRPEGRDTVHEATAALGDDAFNVVGSSPAQSTLSRAEDEARRAGVSSVETVAVEGEPVETLVDVVNAREADVVVIGNRGLNSLSGRLLGSVPSGVSRRAPVDVLIVHTV